MKWDAEIAAKADEALREALRKASSEQTLRLLMVLTPESAACIDGAEVKRADPAQFESRKAYRQALIEERRADLEVSLGTIMKELRKCGLRVQGGKLGRVVVADEPRRERGRWTGGRRCEERQAGPADRAHPAEAQPLATSRS